MYPLVYFVVDVEDVLLRSGLLLFACLSKG